MTFDIARWGRQTVTFNAGRVVLQDGSSDNAPAFFTYASAADTLATVSAANYFSPIVRDVAVNDTIFIQASDANGFYTVTSLNRDLNQIGITPVTDVSPSTVTAEDVQSWAYNKGICGGVADAYTVDLDPAITSYEEGLIIEVIGVVGDNTTTLPTIAVNGLSPVDIQSHYIGVVSGSCAVGDITSGGNMLLMYINGFFLLLNPLISDADTLALMSGKYITGAQTSGASNTYTAVFAAYNSSLTFEPGAQISFAAGFTNTVTNPTLNVNGAGALPILLPGDQALLAGDIVSGAVCAFILGATGWILLNPAVSFAPAKKIQESTYNKGTDTGAADAYAVALSPAISAYTDSLKVSFTPANSNATTTPTLAVNGLAAKTITRSYGAVSALDIVTTQVADCIYSAASGTFVLLNPATGIGTSDLKNLAVTTGKIADDAVTNAKIDPAVMQNVAVTMSAAEWLGMYAAPKLLVPAQGANTLIVLDRITYSQTYVSAAYADGGNVRAQYNSTAAGGGVITSGNTVNTTFHGTVSISVSAVQNANTLPFSTTVNEGLYLSNQTAAFTTGDSTFIVNVWYRVISVV